jgi:NAD+ diphosphatase
MLAFTADYVDGEIVTDPAEIAEARWFTRADMTERYPETSISGRLVNGFFGM